MIYIPRAEEGYEFCHPVEEGDFEALSQQISGSSRLGNWMPIKVNLIKTDEGKALARSDSPWLGAHALIFRDNSIDALSHVLSGAGELLPLSCENQKLFVFNPLRVFDALDETHSSIRRFADGRIMHIGKYVFRPNIVDGASLFKIPNLRVSPTFVTEKFVHAWSSAGLKGLKFKKISDVV